MSPIETKKILIGQKQLQRWHLIKMAEGRKITLREVGGKIENPPLSKWLEEHILPEPSPAIELRNRKI